MEFPGVGNPKQKNDGSSGILVLNPLFLPPSVSNKYLRYGEKIHFSLHVGRLVVRIHG
jgi:hypothetical protein